MEFRRGPSPLTRSRSYIEKEIPINKRSFQPAQAPSKDGPRVNEMITELRQAGADGLRIEADLRIEKISQKVRKHSLAERPFILVDDRREAEDSTLLVRRLGAERCETMTVQAVIALMQRESVAPALVAGL